MKKKIIIIVIVVIVLLGGAFAYLNYRNRTLSPPGTTQLTAGDLTVSVAYSRPSVRGRLIFGTAEQEALLPHGKYWRLGANEATEITFSRDVLVNNEPVKAGSYTIYAFPGEDLFEIGLNSKLGKWGYLEPDYSMDILRTKVPVQHSATPVEQYTVNMEEDNGGINVSFEWSDVKVVVPVQPQP